MRLRSPDRSASPGTGAPAAPRASNSPSPVRGPIRLPAEYRTTHESPLLFLDDRAAALSTGQDPARCMMALRLEQAGLHREAVKVETCDLRQRIVWFEEERPRFLPLHCRARYCPSCGPRQAQSRRWALQGMIVRITDPVPQGLHGTLTCPPEGSLESRDSHIRTFFSALTRKQQWRNKRSGFCRHVGVAWGIDVTPGRHRRGHIHVHMVLVGVEEVVSSAWEWIRGTWLQFTPEAEPQAQMARGFSGETALAKALCYALEGWLPGVMWPDPLFREAVQLLRNGRPQWRVMGLLRPPRQAVAELPSPAYSGGALPADGHTGFIRRKEATIKGATLKDGASHVADPAS